MVCNDTICHKCAKATFKKEQKIICKVCQWTTKIKPGNLKIDLTVLKSIDQIDKQVYEENKKESMNQNYKESEKFCSKHDG